MRHLETYLNAIKRGALPNGFGIKFPESKLAHAYLDGLAGIEIGGSAPNPFGLNTINIDYTANMNTRFKVEEMIMCGQALPVDVVADAKQLPFRDDCVDFVLASHVLEHMWDTIGVLHEWHRVVKPGGYIYLVVPHKERMYDKDRPRTTLKELHERHAEVRTLEYDDHSHFSVWVTRDILELCDNQSFNVVGYREKDDKKDDGFVVVIKKPVRIYGNEKSTGTA